MSDGVAHVNDIGVKFILATDLNLSGQSAVFIKWRKPSGIGGSWTATVEDSPTGTISFTTDSADDLSEAGEWVFAAYVQFSGGNDLYGNSINYEVKRRLF